MKGALLGVAVVIALTAAYLNQNRIRAGLVDRLIGDWELFYFNAQGKGQQIRYVFDYLSVNYTNTHTTQDGWEEH